MAKLPKSLQERIVLKDIKRNHEAWLAAHAKGLGSTDTPTAANAWPWKTPRQLWLEKSGLQDPQPMNEAMELGLAMETPIAKVFQKRTGLEVWPNKALFQHPEHECMLSTPDFFAKDGALKLVEIKNVGAYGATKWEEGVPEGVQLQVQKQLAVTGLDSCYVVALLGGNRLQWQEIMRDEALIEAITKLDLGFWALVESGTPPPCQAGDNEIVSKMFRRHTPGAVMDSPEMMQFCAELLAIKAELKALQDKEDVLQATIKAQMRDCETLTAGEYKVSWKSYDSSSLDTAALKKDHPDLVAGYHKPFTARRFSVKAL